MANKISVILDVATDKAVSGIKGFKKSIDDADGAMGKMKAGASSVFSTLGANAGLAAAAVGTAVVGMAVKSVTAFQDVALEAGKFSDISGLAVEDASRWIEVADHIDVNAGVLEKSFGKLNAAIAKGGSTLTEYGIEVVKAKDGTVDANATFLKTIDTIKGIEDPTKRAQASQAAFGKGWQEMSELINMGSEEILTQMGKVGDAKVINKEELEKARKFRGAMDDLNDAVGDLAVAFGEELVPKITAVTKIIVPLIGQISDVSKGMSGGSDIIGEWAAQFATLNPELEGFIGTEEDFLAATRAAGLAVEDVDGAAKLFGATILSATESMTKNTEGMSDNLALAERLKDGTDELTEAVDRTKDGQEAADKMVDKVNATYGRQVEAADAAREALAELTDAMMDQVASAFDLESSMLTLDSAYAAYQEQVMATTGVVASSEATDREKEQALRDLREQEIGVAADALATAQAYAQEQGAADGSAASAQFQKEKLQELAAAMPELRDEIQTYIDKLNAVPGVITTRFEITATGATVTPHGDFIGLPGGARAAGGPVSAGRSYLVGERGMELFTPAQSGYITPHNAIAAAASSGGAGNTYVLQSLVAPTEAQLQTFGVWIDKHERRDRGMK